MLGRIEGAVRRRHQTEALDVAAGIAREAGFLDGHPVQPAGAGMEDIVTGLHCREVVRLHGHTAHVLCREHLLAPCQRSGRPTGAAYIS